VCCKQDVECERDLYRLLPPLLDDEQRLWQLDQAINDRGFYCDGVLIEKAIAISTAADRAVQAEIKQITGDEIESSNQVDKLLAWLAAHGCELKNLQKPTLSQALRRTGLTPEARRVIELRREAAHASANKMQSLQAWRCYDGRVRGAFKFHGAATGRWSGTGPQPQNFRRESENTAAKFAAVMTADIEAVRRLGAPIEIVGDTARCAICAPPGHRLLIGDFGGIESRVLPWIAGQHDKVEQWAKFDRTQDPNDDPYFILGRALGFPEQTARKYGKVADLAFGYQGGPGAYKNFARGRHRPRRPDRSLQAGLARSASADRPILVWHRPGGNRGGASPRRANSLWPAEPTVRADRGCAVPVRRAAVEPTALLSVPQADHQPVRPPRSNSWTIR
jgi:DNA polymerase bacteriophage-type